MPGIDTDVRCETFELVACGASVAEARHRARARLRQWNVGRDVGETAVLIVSELVTNAIVHSGSDMIGCALWLGNGQLRVEVTDQGTGDVDPRPRVAGADEEAGRGLLLVSTLAETWGVTDVPYGPGRTVWANLALRPATQRPAPQRAATNQNRPDSATTISAT